jgi:hypothetical protein
MYSIGCLYYVCDVTLSVYPHLASLKNMPGHGAGIEPTTFRIPWTDIFFKLARCEYTLRVTSQTDIYLSRLGGA